MTTDEEFKEAIAKYCPEIAAMDKEALHSNMFHSVFIENSSNLYSSKKVNNGRVTNISLTIDWFEDVCTIFGHDMEREPHDFDVKLVVHDSKIPPEYGGSLSGEEDKVYRYTIKKSCIYDIAGCMTSQKPTECSVNTQKENFVKPPPKKTVEMSREHTQGVVNENKERKSFWKRI